MRHDLVVTNTLQNKKPMEQVTYRETHVKADNNQWDAADYAHIDFWLAPNRWKHTITDVTSITRHPIETDHFPIDVRIRPRLKKESKWKQERHIKREYTEVGDNRDRYNENFKKIMQGKEINLNEINESLIEAAEIFPEITHNRKKKHVSAHSLALLKQREELRNKGQVELA